MPNDVGITMLGDELQVIFELSMQYSEPKIPAMALSELTSVFSLSVHLALIFVIIFRLMMQARVIKLIATCLNRFNPITKLFALFETLPLWLITGLFVVTLSLSIYGLFYPVHISLIIGVYLFTLFYIVELIDRL